MLSLHCCLVVGAHVLAQDRPFSCCQCSKPPWVTLRAVECRSWEYTRHGLARWIGGPGMFMFTGLCVDRLCFCERQGCSWVVPPRGIAHVHIHLCSRMATWDRCRQFVSRAKELLYSSWCCPPLHSYGGGKGPCRAPAFVLLLVLWLGEGMSGELMADAYGASMCLS